MFDELRQQVLDANLDLVRGGLVLQTFGNASAISRADGAVIIKPSGVPYDRLGPADMVVTDLDGRVLEGELRPSVDLATHLVLYKAFPEIGAVAHTHSEFATVWAQAGRRIPAFGTTHADYFAGSIPVTRPLTEAEILGDYVTNTGAVIVECFDGLRPVGDPRRSPSTAMVPSAGGGPRPMPRGTRSFSRQSPVWPCTR